MDKITRIFLVIIIFIAGLILIIKNSHSLVAYVNEKFQVYGDNPHTHSATYHPTAHSHSHPYTNLQHTHPHNMLAVNEIKKTKMNQLADVILIGKEYRKLEKNVRQRFPDV